MSTPAVNRNSIKNGKQSYRFRSWYMGNPSAWTVVDQGNIPILWDQETRPASSTVPYGPDGFRACKPWNHSGTLVSRTQGTVRQEQLLPGGVLQSEREYMGDCYWQGFSPVTALGTFPASLISKAEMQALDRLKQQDIHLGNFIAESGKTIQMLTSTARIIAGGVRRFRRDFPKDWDKVVRNQRGGLRRERWRAIPSNWLQLQYGWIPLISDVFGAVNHLQRESRSTALFKVSGKAKDEEVSYRTFVSPWETRSSARISQEKSWEVWVNLYYTLNLPVLAELSSLGLVNPLEIVWECLPYSFIIDWMIPVGGWMSSLTADVGYSFKGGSRSTKAKLRERVVSTNFYTSNSWRNSGSPLTIGGEGTSDFRRSCYSSSPVPGVYFKNPLSWIHAANSLALLVQAFRR